MLAFLYFTLYLLPEFHRGINWFTIQSSCISTANTAISNVSNIAQVDMLNETSAINCIATSDCNVQKCILCRVRQAMTQISLCRCADWSVSLLGALWIDYLWKDNVDLSLWVDNANLSLWINNANLSLRTNNADLSLWIDNADLSHRFANANATHIFFSAKKFTYTRMFKMNCLLSSSSISTWGTIKTNTYLYRVIQYLHNGV